MPRDIIDIDRNRCDGCGLCAEACHEGAIQIIDGVAGLISDSYRDGLGDCLGHCPQDAISITKREAEAYDQAAVDAHLAAQTANSATHACCPYRRLPWCGCADTIATRQCTSSPSQQATAPVSQLGQWPVQLRLVPPSAPYLVDADVLVCADCVPFAVPDFHSRYLANHALLVACPKLDPHDANLDKLTAIFTNTPVRSITVLRMEVPCCGGLAQAAFQAHQIGCPTTPFAIHTIGISGGITEQTIVAS